MRGVVAEVHRVRRRLRNRAECGVVTRPAGPTDGRAKIIRYTPEALKLFDASRRAIEALERRWADELGPREYAAVRAGLEQLLRRHEQ